MTLQEQRLISIRLWGARDARERKEIDIQAPFVMPVFLKDFREQAAYVFGYQQEVRKNSTAAC